MNILTMTEVHGILGLTFKDNSKLGVSKLMHTTIPMTEEYLILFLTV